MGTHGGLIDTIFGEDSMDPFMGTHGGLIDIFLAGIRTRGGGFSPRTHLAGEPNRPLWHLPVGGGRGIRTHDGFLHTCFQDRRLKPLGHPSNKRKPVKHSGHEIPLKRTEFYHIQGEDATFDHPKSSTVLHRSGIAPDLC